MPLESLEQEAPEWHSQRTSGHYSLIKFLGYIIILQKAGSALLVQIRTAVIGLKEFLFRIGTLGGKQRNRQGTC
jgi:hypothetical protein